MLKQSRHAIGNLINRYRAVLRTCSLCNVFGSLAAASAAVMLSASLVSASTLEFTGGSADPALGTGPVWNIGSSLFPTETSSGNTVIVTGGSIAGDVYGNGILDTEVRGNSIEFTGGTVDGDIIAGLNKEGNVSGNSVTMSGTTSATNIYGGFAHTSGDAVGNSVMLEGGHAYAATGGMSATGISRGNAVTLNGASMDMGVYGGQTSTGTAEDNAVTILSGSSAYSVIGGRVNKTGGQAIGNSVVMSGGTVNENLIGGYLNTGVTDGLLSGNTVEISGGTVTKSVYGGQAREGDGVITGNKVVMTDGSVNWLMGGYHMGSGEVSYNTVEVSGGTVNGSISGGDSAGDVIGNSVVMANVDVQVLRGGYSSAADTTGNSVVMKSGSTTGTAFGGDGHVSATGNSFTLEGGTVGKNLIGGLARNGDATGNMVAISDGTVTGNTIGGKSEDRNGGSATGNSVLISGGNAGQFVVGGSSSTGLAENYAVVMTGGTAGTVNGGESSDNTVSGNSVSFSGGTANYLQGGWTNSGNASNNIVNVDGGTVIYNVLGGSVDTGSGSASGNLVAISGGTIEGDVFGGYAGGSGNATDNTVRLSGSADLAASTIYGGLTSTGDAVTGNTLEVSGTQTALDVKNFDTYAFTLASLPESGSSMLTLTSGSGSDISGSTLSVSIPGFAGNTPALAEGESFSLISNANGLTTNDLVIDDAGLTQVKQGVSRLYDFTVQTDDTGVAAVVASARTNPQTKSLSESRLAGTVLAIQGADLIAGQGMNSALRAVDDAGLHHIAGFGTLSGASLSYDTGSSIDMDSLSLLTGLAWSTELDPGIFTAGAFFEYGNGSYDTWNSFTGASSVHGDGDAWYAGGGLLARMDFAPTGPGHFYAEASGRAGGLHNDYDNADLRDAFGRQASYDGSSTYYGLHAGLGYVWNITEKADLDLYGKYLWTHQDGESLSLSTGERLRFDDTDSSRLRLGGRFSCTVTLLSGAASPSRLPRHDSGLPPPRSSGRGSGKASFLMPPFRVFPAKAIAVLSSPFLRIPASDSLFLPVPSLPEATFFCATGALLLAFSEQRV